MRKGVQIYTVRDFIGTKEGYIDSLKKIKEIGYDSVQTYGNVLSRDEHKQIFADLGLHFESVNGDFETMLKDPEALKQAIDDAHFFELDVIAVGTLPIPMRDHADGFHQYAADVNELGAELKKEGLKIMYHPHALEFFSFGGGKNGMDILTSETDPDVFWFALDTHWLQSGGQNPAAYLRKLKGRLPMVHFKDYKIVGGAEFIEQVRKDFAEVGEGNLNWPEIIEACRECGVPSAVVEQDVCPRDPFDCLSTSYKNMVGFGL